jgi:hypothetical protein
MLGLNGTSAGDYGRITRYFLHTTPEGEWGIRDSHTWDWDFVFIHTDREVCEKVLRLFNGG